MPVEFDFTATETNDVLQISFIGSLNDADIIVTDCQGNMVWQEYQTLIYTGDGILISDAKNYPYRINITSPTMDVLGEIDKE